MKNVEMGKYMGDGGLSFLLSFSFYLHPYRKFSDQINKNYGKDVFQQSINCRRKTEDITVRLSPSKKNVLFPSMIVL